LVQFSTRHSTSSQFAAAAAWARQALADLGYGVQQQTIPVGGGTSLNLVAERPGQGAETRDLVLLTAHLDSVNTHGGPSASAPGADDNGSGSAGVLEVARALRDHRGRHDLQLVLFGGEEQGLHGSRHFVARLDAATRRRIRTVVNMDMIGTLNTPQPTVLLEGATVSQAVIDGLAEAAATYTNLIVQTSLHPFNSDHVPFIDAGVPAVLTIEGADSANPHIHTAGDTLDHVNDGLALDILRMNTAYLAGAIGLA
jgi:Zn-dependent M28 family amino/carboxypeptidase